ncbi:nucleotide disphospho-sugar-binding domain-containing protein [Enterococcus sp. AZ103]|uniref:nucleotide disphospho-sugar-binding domain-containing protein n=1 Tax=Enterococcus sp. AZ103 TaxID=2774628 RepID=UPI003F1FDFA2
MVEVAKELRQLNATCFFVAYSKKFAYLIEEAGFEVSYLKPLTSEKLAGNMMKFDQGKSLKIPFSQELVEKRVAAEIDFIKNNQIDKVVIGTSMTLFLSARICQVPLIYVKPFAYSEPQITSGQIFNESFIGILISRAILKFRYVPKAFRQIEKQYQQKVFHRTLDLLEADLNLVTSYPELTGVTKLPANYQFVGFVYGKLSAEIPEKILELRRNSQTLIYFAMGSSANRPLILKLLKILTQLPYTFICPVAYYLPEYKNKKFAENVYIFDWLPTEKVNSLIDLSSIHGGEGTIQTACLSGKPFIGLGLQMEQRYNLKISQKYGNGYQLSKHDITQEKLEKILELVLTDSTYQKKAEILKQKLLKKSFNGAKKAAEIILEYPNK